MHYEKPYQNLITFVSHFEYNYSDDYFLASDLDPNLRNDKTHLVNLRFGIRQIDQAWELTVWGKNILDEEYLVVGFDLPVLSGYAGVMAPEESYGISLQMKTF